MVDFSTSIAATADDGQSDTTGGNFQTEQNSNSIGKFSTILYHNFWRFTSVTIPDTAIIDSCVVRFTSGQTISDNTVNVNVHFEAADDPAAPTTGADLIGRSLGSAVAWDAIAAWTVGNTYDTPDLTEELQAVIDRGGWNSGQAVIVHTVNNASVGTFPRRNAADYSNTTYDPAELIVTYHEPYQANTSESVEVSESVTIETDLVREENVTISESVTALLGFDGSLPTITEDIEITESVTVTRGLAGLPTQIESIEISESVTALLGFDESLPEQSESLTVTEYTLVDVGPQIVVFESITFSDYGNIQPEFSADDSISIAEDIEIYRGYWADVDDNFIFTDKFSVFNYTDWLKTNKAKSKERFFFTLTGASDQTDDIEIPVSNVFARKRTDDPTYLQVTIPSFNYSGDIAIRSNAEMIVEMGYEIDGEIALREQILIADLEDIAVYEGPVNRSVTLSGHKTIAYSSNLIVLARDEVIYRAVQTRARVFRFSHIDPFLNPGDTVVIGDESMTCNNIIYTIGATRSVMEVREAL